MRLSAGSLDIDAFRSFLEAAGATLAAACPASSELLRFQVGKARGVVSKRKNGSLTLAGEASRLYLQFKGTLPHVRPAPVEKPPAKPAEIITATLSVEYHERARELLADAKKAVIHTDGSSAKGGLGFGGWAAVIQAGFVTVEIYGGAAKSTVNRMEIIAAIVALEVLPPGCVVSLRTDSKYLRDGITKWIDGWKRNGWITFAREPVKNSDLWLRLDIARAQHTVTWKWVKAHRGIAQNERADELAKHGRHLVQNATGTTIPTIQPKGSSDVIAQ